MISRLEALNALRNEQGNPRYAAVGPDAEFDYEEERRRKAQEELYNAQKQFRSEGRDLYHYHADPALDALHNPSQEYRDMVNARTRYEQIQNEIQNPPKMNVGEELQYASNVVGGLSPEAQEGLKNLAQLQQDAYSVPYWTSESIDNVTNYDEMMRRAKIGQDLKTAREEFKKNNNLTDEQLDGLLDFQTRLNNKERNDLLNSQAREAVSTGSRASQIGNAAALTGLSILTSPFRGGAALIENEAQKRLGRSNLGTDIYAPGYDMQNMANAARGAVGERIENSRLGSAGRTVYEAGLSSAESLYRGAIAAATGIAPEISTGSKALNFVANKGLGALEMLPTIGADAYAGAYQNARQRGLSDENAQATAIASGLIEVGTEVFSLDNLFDVAKGGSRLLRKPLMAFISQNLIEGSEEFASEGLNAFADWMINKGESEYNQTVNAYMAEGMSEQDAKRKATADVLKDAVVAFGGGALAGAMGGAGATAVGLYNTNRQARQMFDQNTDYAELAESIDTDEANYKNKSAADSAQHAKDLAEKLNQKKANGEKISNRELRDLYWSMMDAVETESEARQDNTAAAAEQNPAETAQNLTDNVQAAPEAATNAPENAQIATETAQPVADQAENASDGQNTNESTPQVTAEDIKVPEKYKVSRADRQATYKRISSAQTIDEMAAALQEVQETGDQEAIREAQSHFDVFSGRMAKELNLTDAQINDAKEKPQTRTSAYVAGYKGLQVAGLSPELQEAYNEGKIAAAEGPKAQASEKRMLNNYAQNYATVGERKAFLETYKPGSIVERHRIAFDTAYDAGRQVPVTQKGIDAEAAYNNAWQKLSTGHPEYARLLGEDTVRSMFDAGIQQSMEDAQTEMVRSQRSKLYKKGTGKFEDLRTNNTSDIDTRALSAITSILNIDTELRDDLPENVNGYYDEHNSKIVLNANSGNVMTTFSHELFEFANRFNTDEFKPIIQDFMNALRDIHGDEEYQAIRSAYQDAYSFEFERGTKTLQDLDKEIAADHFFSVLYEDDGIEKLFAEIDKNHSAEEAKTLKEKVLDLINAIVDKFREMILGEDLSSSQRKAIEAGLGNLYDLQDRCAKAVAKAVTEYEQAPVVEDIKEGLGKGSKAVIGDDGSLQLVESADGSTIVVNVASMGVRNSMKTMETTQRALEKALRDRKFSEDEIQTAIDTINNQADYMAYISAGYKEMQDSLDTDVIKDIHGRKHVLMSLLKNGEYPVNIDFSTICKKRQSYMRVLTDLINDGTFSTTEFGPEAIAEVNNVLRDKGYETACLGCFVESRRLNIQKWAESFVEAWNRQVDKRLKVAEAESFGFGRNGRGNTSLTPQTIQQLDEEFKKAGKTNDKGNLNLGQGKVEDKMGRLLDKMPSLAKKLEVGDLIKPDAVANLRATNGNLYSLIQQWYGSNTPKINQDFNPYNGEISALTYAFMKKAGETLPKGQKYRTWAKQQLIRENSSVKGYEPSKQQIEDRALQKYLYDIGGARLQSFSDFLIENTLDYFQMVGDLYARRFPMHAYSKEISFARIFGMTGMKVNMSLIPVVNKSASKEMAGLNPDGTYAGWGDLEHHIMMYGKSFIQSIGFKDAIALQMDPRYSSNVGTIAIGVSDAHIRKMLNDELIRMVIPYHSSGMNPAFAKRMDIDYYTDYTDFQNTKVKQFYDLDGNPVDSLGSKDKIKYDMEYNYNEAAQRLGDARKAANEYIDWCAQQHNVYSNGKKVGTVTYTPKFERFTTGEGSENYYKLLEDFNMYDSVTGEPAMQKAVEMRYPDSQNALTPEQLQAYEDRLRGSGVFSEADIKKYADKVRMTTQELIKKEAEGRNLYRRDADKKYAETYKAITDELKNFRRKSEGAEISRVMDSGDDLRKSVKVSDPGILQMLNNQEHITTYRSFQVIDGGLYAPMASMDYEVDEKGHKKEKKLGYRSEIGQWEQATEAINVARTNFANGKKAKDKITGLEYAKFDLEGGDNQTGGVAYNPYLHSSNVVLNDQFAAAYRRNLVVVECVVPASELTSGYHAELAKDPTGWREWKSGAVAGEIAKQKEGFERQVFLSRWMKPVRILSDSEVAALYKEYLAGTNGIKVPWNVVTPSLRHELEKQGVQIDYSDRKFGSTTRSFADAFPNESDKIDGYARFSVKTDSKKRKLSIGQQEYFKNSKIRDDNGDLKVLYHGTENDFTVFDFSQGGKNGTAEGFGIYLTDNPEVSQSYGGRIIEGYANITKPAYADKRTLKRNDLIKLIRETINVQAKEMAEDYDGDIEEAKRDTWISNYVYTYDKGIAESISEVADSILNMNDNDMDIIQEVMTGRGIRNYPEAEEFYDLLTRTTGIDGFVTNWKNRETGADSQIVLAFRSNQIKNADNENPTEDPDIRFSINGQENGFDFGGDNKVRNEGAKILELGAEALKNQEVDRKTVRKIASDLRARYGSRYNLTAFTDNMERVFAYAQSGDFVNYRDLMKVLEEVARPVIEEAGELVGQERYDEFMGAMKGYTIALTPNQKEEVISTFGSYQNFRNAMGGIRIANNGTSLDSIWDEICDRVPGLERDTVEGDQPEALYDMLQAMKPTVKNGYGMDMEEAARDLSLQIVEKYYEEAGKKNSKVAAAAEQMKKQNEEYRKDLKETYLKRINEAKQAMGAHYDKETAQLRARLKKRAQDAKARREQSEQVRIIRKEAGELLNWAANPNKEHHVMNSMLEPVMDLLSAMDFATPKIERTSIGYQTRVWDPALHRFQTIDGNTYTEVQEKVIQAIQQGSGSAAQRRWSDKMAAIQDIYTKVQKGESFDHRDMDDLVRTISPALGEELKDVLDRNRDVVQLSDLEVEDLKVIKDVIRNVKHAVEYANKAFTENVDLINTAQKTIRNGLDAKNSRAERSRMGNRIVDFTMLDMATPETYFDLAGTPEVYQILRQQGLNKKIHNVRQISEAMEDIMKGVKPEDVKKWRGTEETIHTFKLLEGTIKMSDAQIMSLYELNKRQQAKLHQPGGITIDTLEIGKGLKKIQHKQSKAVHLSEADIKHITSALTPEQIRIADAMQQYMANECAKMGNDATMKMWGYELFTDPNYFPIRVDDNSISMQSRADVGVTNAIANMGFTKRVNAKARNAVVVQDIFSVFAKHTADMATYNAYAPAIADALRWYNYKETTSSNNVDITYSVQNALQKMLGDKGKQYFEQLITDLNEKERSSYIATPFEGLISNYKVAAIAANARVVIQQPTAIVRASNVIDPKYLTGGLSALGNLKGAAERMKESSDIAWWKSQGYYESDIGPSMERLITGQSTVKETLQDKALAAAGAADDITWSVIYRAVELETQDKFKEKGKSIDSEAYKKEVSRRFDDVIDQTQVVDATLLRSQYMRSKDALNKLNASFMAEPTKSYNMLMKAWVNAARHAQGSGARKYVNAAASKAFMKAAATFVATGAVNAAAQAVLDALRGAGKEDDKYGTRYINAYVDNIKENVNPLLLLPWVKDAADILISGVEGIISGEGSYSGSTTGRMDLDALSSFMTAIQGTVKYAKGQGKKTLYGVINTDVRALSQLTGIPAYNLMRDMTAIYNQTRESFTGLPDLFETSTDNVKKKAKSGVFTAIDAGGDYKAAIKSATDKGVSLDTIEKNITTQYKPQYLELLKSSPSEAAKLENRLMIVYEYIDKQQGQKSKTDRNRVKNWAK